MGLHAEQYFPTDGTSAVSGMTEATDFERAFTLLAIISDPSGCKARLAELQKQIAAAAKAQAKLDSEREQHDRKAAELDAREAALRVREEACAAAEAEYFQQQPRERYPASPNLEPGGMSHSGLTREAYRS
jgi:hypothetical protein